MKMTKKDRYRIKILEKRIADGDLESMMEYAKLYQGKYREEVTPEIAQKIVTCYETCIQAGNLTAALNLGAMYYGGEFIPRNFRKAIRYYEQATEADDKETQILAWTNLGYCYYYGRDIPVDNEKAFNCYMRAAVQRDANALYGIGMEKDIYRALSMLTKAELLTYTKIKERDPFAASLLPKIKQMLNEAKAQVEWELGL